MDGVSHSCPSLLPCRAARPSSPSRKCARTETGSVWPRLCLKDLVRSCAPPRLGFGCTLASLSFPRAWLCPCPRCLVRGMPHTSSQRRVCHGAQAHRRCWSSPSRCWPCIRTAQQLALLVRAGALVRVYPSVAVSPPSGVAVDIGDRLDIVPLDEGYIFDKGVTRLPVGERCFARVLPRHCLAFIDRDGILLHIQLSTPVRARAGGGGA